MKPLELKSYLGAGPYLIGMTRAEMRRSAGISPRAVKKGGLVDSDVFDALGVIAFYDRAEAVVEALEFFPPAQPQWKGQALVGRPYSEVRNMIFRDDSAIQEDGAGLTSEALGIGVYAPSASKEPCEPVESAILFRRGYYEKTAALLDELRAKLLK